MAGIIHAETGACHAASLSPKWGTSPSSRAVMVIHTVRRRVVSTVRLFAHVPTAGRVRVMRSRLIPLVARAT